MAGPMEGLLFGLEQNRPEDDDGEGAVAVGNVLWSQLAARAARWRYSAVTRKTLARLRATNTLLATA